MSLDVVVFLPPGPSLSELELSIAKRYTGSDVLFVVCGSKEKCDHLKGYFGSFPLYHANIVGIQEQDYPRLSGFLAQNLSGPGSEVDITFAPPYLAASVALTAKAAEGRVVVTSGDGSVAEVGPPKIDYGSLDYDDILILRKVSLGISDSSSLAEETGINYKTLSRRLSRLSAEGFLECSGGRPKRYTTTEAQSVMASLSRPRPRPGDYNKVASIEEGKCWTLYDMEIVLDRSLSSKGEKE